MTEDDLVEIERQYAHYTRIFGIGEAEAHVPTLIAEIRHLRAMLLEERAYHIYFENLSVLSWRDIPAGSQPELFRAAEASLHVPTVDLHDWLHDPER